MPPAQQCLEAHRCLDPQIDQRLIEQFQLAAAESCSNIDLQQAPRLHLGVHVLLEHPVDAAPVLLRTVQRQVGAFQQLVGIGPILRETRCRRWCRSRSGGRSH